jgi:hypothetical protein
MAPDKALEKGSRRLDPPAPKQHIWEVVCDKPGAPVDELIADVVSRLEPHRPAIQALVATGQAVTELVIVRYLGAWLAEAEGEEEEHVVTEDGLEKLSGQHQLLGFVVEPSVLEFLVAVGATISFDEYG